MVLQAVWPGASLQRLIQQTLYSISWTYEVHLDTGLWTCLVLS